MDFCRAVVTILFFLSPVPGSAAQTADFTMFDWMNLAFRSDQEPLPPEERSAASEAIVTGYIETITAGRTIVNVNDLPTTPPILTSLVKVRVEEVLKGSSIGSYVYFEYPSGSISPDILNKSKYEGLVMLFLGRTGWNPDSYTFHDSPDGLMSEVDKLYGLTRDSAFFIETEKLVSQPLNDGQQIDGNPDVPIRSLEELKALINNTSGEMPTPYIPESVSSEPGAG